MTALVIKGFSGMRPALNPRWISDSESQSAKNAKLNNGSLRAMKGGLNVNALTLAVQTIYRYSTAASDTQYWLEFADDANVFLSPTIQDQHKRIYWSTATSTYAKYAPQSVALGAGTLPSAGYTLGVPKPSATPTASGTAAVTYTKQNREYVVVFTGTTNSAPSAVTSVTAVNTFEVKLTNIPVPPTSSTYTGKNLYRRDALVAGSSYKLVASIGLSDTEYTDTVADASLGATYTVPAASAVSIPGDLSVEAPSLTSTGAAITRWYAYSVGGYNESYAQGESGWTEFVTEGPLSANASINVDTTQDVTISGLTKGAATSATYFRIYRKDGTNGEFVQIAQIPTTQTTYLDTEETASGTPFSGSTAGSSNASPTLAASASTAVNASTAPGRIYCATYVNASGTESYRSAESALVRVVDGVTPVKITLPYPVPSGASKIRLYRRTVTVSGGTTTGTESDYKLLMELPATHSLYTDTATAASISGSSSLANTGERTPPSGGMVGAATIPDDVLPETRLYVFTYVTAYDEEGPPSEPSAAVDIDPAQAVTVSGLGTGPGATISVGGVSTAVSYNITKKRIYRSSTGNVATSFQFVAEIPVATSSYADNVKQTDLGEILTTEGWIAAGTGDGANTATTCNPAIKGLVLTANGIAAGFVGKTVHFSEPYQPHTYPAEFTQTTEFDIVGLAAFGQSVAVLTTANPYLASGVDPSAMTMQKLPLQQSCVSKRSICQTGSGVIYASPDGLVSLSESGAQILTTGLLSRDQWQTYSPSSMLIQQYNNRIYVFHSTGLIVFDFTGESATMTIFDQTADAAYYDPVQDALYIAKNGTGILKWDYGNPLTYVWKTKLFTMTYPMNFSFGQVEASAYPITFKIYADGVLKHTKSVTDRNPFRLPAGFRAKDWEVELSGTGEVFSMVVAESALEVRKI